ncbi:sn-glycerol-3-phosphate ABC transporter ATP-binding protein UgpC [Shinella sp. 838]|uniref:ABC transporter ATP-binding protein n=1 Tax=Shinella sp. 838 TaxID=3038164 RepID=UPI0024155448|nr:sn-glycerol-3-phosphate ABC transporter ATP-binding protein UgpC [Shinella sp. 838]MDG4674915.1 sn-glycerol-3-phosphate ABC transporter ATP-binding protein UgpC [Shinella sp. 838]
MSEVSLKGVSKNFGEVRVIHGVDLEVEKGSFCVFVGPSGCGKSTLLRMIAGLETTTRGAISIGERDVTNVDAAKRGIAMVFQSYALYPHMTVRENMSFGLKMSGVPKAEVASKVDEAARILKLDPYLDRKPRALSGGQRQRVAIGRAIVRAPEVFLFDEPLSNLDAELRVQMRLELARLHRELGATMIYVTHDQVEAMTLADKIVVLRAGRIEQAGPPLALYEDPDNLFVAQFIGYPRMNIVEGTVIASEGGQARIAIPALGDLVLPVPHKEPLAQGRAVLAGMRPQQFGPEGDVAILIRIDAVENLGGVTFAYAEIEGSEAPFCIESRKPGQEVGGMLETRFASGSAMIFDPATGQRLRG